MAHRLSFPWARPVCRVVLLERSARRKETWRPRGRGPAGWRTRSPGPAAAELRPTAAALAWRAAAFSHAEQPMAIPMPDDGDRAPQGPPV